MKSRLVILTNYYIYTTLIIHSSASNRSDNPDNTYRFVSGSKDDENWEELVEVTVSNSTELQGELVKLLYEYMDNELAIKWAIRFAVPEEKLPEGLVPLIKTECRSEEWVTLHITFLFRTSCIVLFQTRGYFLCRTTVW